MTVCQIDHLVVTSPTLESGASYIRQLLGVDMQPGGKHPAMGTHNMVLKLGGQTYLEVISIDPEANPPNRPRWFSMDDQGPDTPPQLTTWVVRSEKTEESLAACPETLGEVTQMSRGKLNWQITIPKDGQIIRGGTLPSLIEWEAETHPATSMLDKGCTLKKLELYHPDAGAVLNTLNALNFKSDVEVLAPHYASTPFLRALIDTPWGMRTIDGLHP